MSVSITLARLQRALPRRGDLTAASSASCRPPSPPADPSPPGVSTAADTEGAINHAQQAIGVERAVPRRGRALLPEFLVGEPRALPTVAPG